MAARLRVAVAADFLEEEWPSMDLAAEMLLHYLRVEHADRVIPVEVRPAWRRRFAPAGGRPGPTRNLDRFLNRFREYPRHLRRLASRFDVYHILDHSYAHLAHVLPAGRAVVTCYDLDAVRCVIDPERDPRAVPLQWMARQILSGLRSAARVICVSTPVREEILHRGIVAPERLALIPAGVHPSCSPDPDPAAYGRIRALLGLQRTERYLLHVGSTIPRKRIDVLLQVFAALRGEHPDLVLARVGGPLSPEQLDLAARLGVEHAIHTLPFLDRPTLAAAYRSAAVVLQPSAAEGFGLPVVEALACGAPVVASDIPVLREVGGSAAEYCPVGDVAAWTRAVDALLRQPVDQRTRAARLKQASEFRWDEHVRRVVRIYAEVAAQAS